jgi:hypothetical protein
MDSPPELLPYLLTNEPYPLEFKPILRTYLAQVALSISELDDDINLLQRAIDAKRRRREQFRKKHLEHTRLESPIRQIPYEIWGLIIGFALGKGPFGRQEYKMYGYLQEVCTTWRDVVATTPDLCRGLVVHLDGPLAETPYCIGAMMGVPPPRDRMEQWLALVSRDYPYHLVLDVEDEDAFDWGEADVAEVVHQRLATVPSPAILSIKRASAFSLAYANAPKDNRISHLALDFEFDVDRIALEETPFQDVFPCLKTLVIKTPIESFNNNPLHHSSLQNFTLTRFRGSAYSLLSALSHLPTLRELRLGLQMSPGGGGSGPTDPLLHPALEVLVIEGEQMVSLLRHATFPSLKFLGLNAWGVLQGHKILTEVIPAFFQRCSLNNKGLFVGIKGRPSKLIFDLIASNIPLGSQVHLDIATEWDEDDERVGAPHFTSPTQTCTFTTMFCNRLPEDFDWLADSNLPGSKPTNIYLPKGLLEEEEELGRRLLGLGYDLQILKLHLYSDMLVASMPQINVEWKV